MGECFLAFHHGASDKPGLPEFTYTGSYTTVDDGNDNWRIKFLTSGTLTITKLNGAKGGIDIFGVGGGGGGAGGGGCGGFTKTVRAAKVSKGAYSITVGAGGNAGAYGGTSAFGDLLSVGGGGSAQSKGGSGGGGYGYYASSTSYSTGGAGGSDGGNGVNGYGTEGFRNGTGQGTTTREFGEATGTLYAGGGGGAANYRWHSGGAGGDGGGGAGGRSGTNYDYAGTAGTANTGGGGGGGNPNASGGSGIVIIRNKR